MGRGRVIAALFGATLSLLASPAPAANWLELNFGLFGPRYDGNLPSCDDPWVLGRISGRFAEKEGRFWVSDLAIVGFDQAHEIAFRPWVMTLCLAATARRGRASPTATRPRFSIRSAKTKA